ncbi:MULTISPECIES: phosphoribosyltransferase [Thalassolituus]|jgi:hypoxanthine phosphoribosyltransferase|uniref:phosphoribosyltransferase n=1 Tax=Thalassolituus TaxID=187492 RepID=UPI001CE350CC|nr:MULTISPECIES: phosphoribosyltransferase family protein [Thalassolituus]MBU2037623.1 hypoxanthine phosphoribosyltransferase [Gammaproteobacteria bacterium]MCA6059498.1 hypoxanthine phosphoribosyltransferase [Thalassolituus sp. ST750PaO-4]MCB2385628.1 hypoxanthine phosphoribosyltransferase [Thalassolituus alkanivorans]MCB2422725.1 hypoxanthine phosphoribosyltransferase [Thalassolituus alkanivorans]
MQKRFLDEETVIQDAFRLGVQIFESGFRPTFIVGLWRGGSSVGIYVQECLQTLGVKTDHIALRTSYRGLPAYQSMVQSPEDIRVHGTQYLVENLNVDDGLLIVDDVFSTGYNISAVINRLQGKLKRNMPSQVKVATLWQRPAYNRVDFKPDFCLRETDDWLVFPYELKGLSEEEIAANKPWVEPFLRKADH